MSSTHAPTRSLRNAPIPVRRMDFEFPEDLPAHWFDDNPYLGALFASMSVSFPAGERFFIRSVLHYLPQIDDPALREAVRGFVGQEGNHTKEHLAFNRFLDRVGVPAKAMEDFVEQRLVTLTKTAKPELNLARTVALEHFTAILASAFLEHPEVLDRMSPEAAQLWGWHAIEEIEHRDVAFDVYAATVADEELRVRTMAVATVLFILVNTIRTGWILHRTGGLGDFRSAGRAAKVLFGRRGVFRDLGPVYRSFYKPDFHPSQHDVGPALARAKARYLKHERGAEVRA